MTSETTMIDTNETLNQLVARAPETLPVLYRYGLDTCCGGALTLAAAAEHHGLNLGELVAALLAAQEASR
jgi:iron-sulfur cluster repair protein YtfE (RIC family)